MWILIETAKLFLRAAYFFMKLGPSGNKAVFISRQGDEPSTDFAALADALEAEGLETEMCLHRQEKDNARFMAEAGANLSAILRQMKAIAGARVAVTDGYSIPVSILKHRKSLTVIQIWHAIGAVKKFGLQTVPSMGEDEKKRASMLKMHGGYDYFVAPSRAAARFFAEAFGMGADKALITGTPYLDALSEGRFNRADRSGDMAALYPEIAGNDAAERPAKVVLYVPTYRKAARAEEGEDAGTRGGDALRDALGADGFIVIERKHPIDEAGETPSLGFSAEELMYHADVVVTDYSSLAITVALLGKPLYFYLYDIDEYRNSPGLNIDPEKEYGKYAARGADELARLIREGEYDHAYERGFAGKYVETFDGNCTERLTAEILRSMDILRGVI
ncbi:MAG: CDP-glycerol glycerophosphotransferase family protein [Clostridiales Family XIII bacterium]|jgi:CDP-ribitol ribitolphosphotransferase|nr:CDP-glycerol glycerophosphotransferase family protein [Clostridiales Family XIII bacterium]